LGPSPTPRLNRLPVFRPFNGTPLIFHNSFMPDSRRLVFFLFQIDSFFPLRVARSLYFPSRSLFLHGAPFPVPFSAAPPLSRVTRHALFSPVGLSAPRSPFSTQERAPDFLFFLATGSPDHVRFLSTPLVSGHPFLLVCPFFISICHHPLFPLCFPAGYRKLSYWSFLSLD